MRPHRRSGVAPATGEDVCRLAILVYRVRWLFVGAWFGTVDCLAVQCFRCAACDGAGEWVIGAVGNAGMPDFTFGGLTYLASARFCEPSNPLPEQGSPLEGTAHMGTGHGKGVRGNCAQTEGQPRLVDG